MAFERRIDPDGDYRGAAELGVFGLTIPEEYDGLGMSKASMAVVSEELSRGYIGLAHSGRVLKSPLS